MATLNDALTRLYARAAKGARMHDLQPMIEACRIEGDPQDSFDVVHVAGTNGKGSVAATVAAIWRAAGVSTGFYSSPHLHRYHERIQIDGKVIDDACVARLLDYAMTRHPDLTFFEVTTLLAFLAFRDARVRTAVLEVGLGGRLDATNVVARPLVSIITTISFDHTEILGNTLEAISSEKAGIIKPSIPVVTGRLCAEAASLVEARVNAIGAGPLWRLGHELSATRYGDILRITGPEGRQLDVEPRLEGAHQQENAALAVGSIWLAHASNIPRCPAQDAIQRGVRDVSWPGRLERVVVRNGALEGRYLLDGAHNEQGVRTVLAALGDAGARARGALVFGVLADKQWPEMLRLLAPLFGVRVFVTPSVRAAGRRGVSPADLLSVDPGGLPAATLPEALSLARLAVGRDATVVVVGSLYLVGEARSLLLGQWDGHPHVGL